MRTEKPEARISRTQAGASGDCRTTTGSADAASVRRRAAAAGEHDCEERECSETGATNRDGAAPERARRRESTRSREEHREPVDAEPDAAGRGHAVREGLDVVGVALLGFGVSGGEVALLLGEARRLLLGVVDLRERIPELDTPSEILESFDDRRVVVGRPREGESSTG